MRNQNHSTDYNHIRIYGTIMGWTKGLILGQQQIAMMVNAPYDTCEIIDGNIIRFYDLNKEVRKQFCNLIINKKDK